MTVFAYALLRVPACRVGSASAGLARSLALLITVSPGFAHKIVKEEFVRAHDTFGLTICGTCCASGRRPTVVARAHFVTTTFGVGGSAPVFDIYLASCIAITPLYASVVLQEETVVACNALLCLVRAASSACRGNSVLATTLLIVAALRICPGCSGGGLQSAVGVAVPPFCARYVPALELAIGITPQRESAVPKISVFAFERTFGIVYGRQLLSKGASVGARAPLDTQGEVPRCGAELFCTPALGHLKPAGFSAGIYNRTVLVTSTAWEHKRGPNGLSGRQIPRRPAPTPVCVRQIGDCTPVTRYGDDRRFIVCWWWVETG